MRHGYTDGLAQRLERHNPDAHLICEALVTTAEDIKDTRDEWLGADSLSGVTMLLDGGVKITGSVATLAENTTVTTTVNDLDNASPWAVAMVKWAPGADLEKRRITALTADLVNQRAGGSPGEVTFWRARLYRVHQIEPLGVHTLALLGDHVDVAAGAFSTSSAEITFDFSYGSLGVEIGPPSLVLAEDVESTEAEGESGPTGVGKTGSSFTVIMITAMKGEGVAAGNVGWDVDGGNASAASGSDTVSRQDLTSVNNRDGNRTGLTQFAFESNNGIPVFALKSGTFSAQTVAFTAAGNSNEIDLGVAPTAGTKLRITAQGEPHSTSTITYQINDGVQGMTTCFDGDIIGEDNSAVPQEGADLSAFVRQQNYDIQVVLTPNTGLVVTPVVRRFGVSEIVITDLDGLVNFGATSHEVDPVTLRGNLPEIELELLRDGLIDYRDAATDLLSDNHREALEFRIWMGHRTLARKDWLHIEDYVIDEQEAAGPSIKLTCVSPIALALTNIPAKSGTTRAPLVYAASTLKATYDDILTSQIINFPGRRIGAQIEDAVTTVTKTITGPVKAKEELDRLANLAGGGITASQGRLKFVEMFPGAAAVAIFPKDTIKMLRVDSGYKDRRPDVAVRWGWNTTKENDFADESYSSVTNAITNFGRALIDRPENLDDEELEKWIPGATLADVISKRVTQNFASGVPLFAFESIYQTPWLEPGDPIAFETDRLVIRDPNTGLAYRGPLWAMGRICRTHDLQGSKYTVWVRSFQDIIPTTAATTRDAFAITPQVTGIEITFDHEAEVVVSAAGDVATANMYVTVGDGSAPSDPTVGSNDGIITGRTGSVATAIGVTTGNEAFVKVVAANLDATLGPVQSSKNRRELGPFHKDATTRSHTGDTNDTLLQTVTLPANRLGTDGGIRISAVYSFTGTAGNKILHVKFGSHQMIQTHSVGSTVTAASVDGLLINNAATNAQTNRSIVLWHQVSAASGYGNFLTSNTAAIDTTSDVTIEFRTTLSNAADTTTLQLTLIEYLGSS